jgi:hypothetical protein
MGFFHPRGEALEARRVLVTGVLYIGDVEVNEEDGTAVFPVTFEAMPNHPGGFSVNWSTADGSAHAGESYTGASGILHFSGTDETKYITISLIDDAIVELTKEFDVNLGAITGDPGCQISVAGATGTAQIRNTDTTNVRLRVAQGEEDLDEGTSGATHPVHFEVILDDPVETAVTVNWSTANLEAQAGVDYVAGQGTAVLTSPIGDSFSVTVNDDGVVERHEAFVVAISGLNAGSLTQFVSIFNPTVYPIIHNDDHATINILFVEPSYGEGVGTVTVDFELIGRVDHAVQLNIISAGGTATTDDDFAAVDTNVTFDAYPGNTALLQTRSIEVAISNDNWVEAQFESFTILMDSIDAGGGGRDVRPGTPSSRIMTIEDNDSATLSITDASVNEFSDDGGTLHWLHLSKPIDIDYTLTYYTIAVSASADDFDHVMTPVQITIPAGFTIFPFIIGVVDDSAPEPTETFEVRLGGLSSSREVTIGDGIAIGTIEDNDET